MIGMIKSYGVTFIILIISFIYFFHSWRQLGELLGYKESKLEQFEGSYHPSRSLLRDWLESCGTNLGTEMILACLNEMKRFDVVEVIVESEGIIRIMII